MLNVELLILILFWVDIGRKHVGASTAFFEERRIANAFVERAVGFEPVTRCAADVAAPVRRMSAAIVAASIVVIAVAGARDRAPHGQRGIVRCV